MHHEMRNLHELEDIVKEIEEMTNEPSFVNESEKSDKNQK